MDFSDFNSKWGEGGTGPLADLLLGVLKDADQDGRPLEAWDPSVFALMRQALLDQMHKLRFKDFTAQRLAELAAQRGKSPTPAQIDRDLKIVRNRFKVMQQEAMHYLRTLERRVLNEKTRARTCIGLREWRRVCNDVNISPKQAAKALQEFLRHDYFDAPSDNLTRQLVQTIERADFETEGRDWPTARGSAEKRDAVEHWTYELMPPEEGRKREGAFLPAVDIDQKLRAAMAAYASSLGDRDSDLMIFAMARFASRAKNPGDKVTIKIEELMQALGYVPHRGGGGGETYRAEDKAAVRERFEALQNGYLSIRKAGKDGRTNRTIDIESLVLVIEDRIGQADLDGRVKEWTAVTVRFGSAWAHRLYEPDGKMTALLQEKALAYDAKKERLEKRLLKRLGWFWKLNLKREPVTPPRTVMAWLREDIGDNPADYRLRRDAERLEQAFDRLKLDGQIAAWRYVDGLPRINEVAGDLPKGWAERWLEREITVEAPQSLQMAYEERKGRPAIQAMQTVEEDRADDFGRKFRAFRTGRNISALEAAMGCSIAPSTLSRIENGKRPPTDDQRRLMEGWMRDLKNRPDKLREAVGK